MSDRHPAPTVRRIREAVADYYGLDPRDLMARAAPRAKGHTPRQMAMFLAREMTGHSYQALGRMFDGRDHSTIRYGCEKMRLKIAREPRAALEADLIRRRLPE